MKYLVTWFSVGVLLREMQPCLGLDASACMAHLTNACHPTIEYSGNSNSSINEIKIITNTIICISIVKKKAFHGKCHTPNQTKPVPVRHPETPNRRNLKHILLAYPPHSLIINYQTALIPSLPYSFPLRLAPFRLRRA